MKAILIQPPMTDPTCGYLSLSYLASYARSKRDYEVSIIDANVEALHFCARPGHISQLLEEANARFDRLSEERAVAESKLNQEEYVQLSLARQLEPQDVQEAIATLQSPTDFLDLGKYYAAATTLIRWQSLLSVDGIIGQFKNFALDFKVCADGYNLETLTQGPVLDRLAGPFAGYTHEELLPEIASRAPDVIGIGVTYHSQLPFALYLAKEIRARFPGRPITMGGTDVSQAWKYTKATGSFVHLFKYVDAFVIGEGESAFVELLDAYAEERDPGDITNVATRGKYEAQGDVTPRYEDLEELPTPSFDDLPWDKYLSPQKFFYYAPTRGCYWDKCAFCDYGLAEGRPTSPWRQRSIDSVVADLAQLSRDSKYVYFSVDVIAPAFLTKLARRIVDEGIEIRWGAELRLEPTFDSESCDLLAQSGCVGISVGFESGNQRVLDLMNKGTKVESTKRVIQSFAAAGIGVQIMGFTDFPTESYEEALDSVRVLEELREDWIFGGLGSFVLAPGAIAARKPDQFGIAEIEAIPGEDTPFHLTYKLNAPAKSEDEKRSLDERIYRLQRRLQLKRPFLGGIDTAHTYFYFGEYGTSTGKKLDSAVRKLDKDTVSTLLLVNLPKRYYGMFARALGMISSEQDERTMLESALG